MSLELDHILICVAHGAPECARLAGLGLTEGTPNTHPGQGTACRRFFFRNAYLEFLWVHAPAEAMSEEVRRTRLWDRWSGRGGDICPFGFCFRPAKAQTAELPFETWQYRPSYLPKHLCIEIGSNVDFLTEPMLCYLAFAQRPDQYPSARAPLFNHAVGLSEITRTELVSPHADCASPNLRRALTAASIRLCPGTQYLVELGFDAERRGHKVDCRPQLPLVLCW